MKFHVLATALAALAAAFPFDTYDSDLIEDDTDLIQNDTSSNNHTLFARRPKGAINCKGSGLCPKMDGVLAKIEGYIVDGIRPHGRFKNEQKIACNSFSDHDKPPTWGGGKFEHPWGVCAFPQHVPKGYLTGLEIKRLIPRLRKYGCKACGSISIEWPYESEGELTVNFVSRTNVAGVLGKTHCPEGLCPIPKKDMHPLGPPGHPNVVKWLDNIFGPGWW